MSATPGHQDLWGDLFEIAVKRGVLSYLLHRQLVAGDHPQLQPWRRQTVRDLRNHLHVQLSATDPHYLQRAQSWLDHLLVNGHGLGWTCLRESLNRPDRTHARQPRLEALWCPLTLRDRRPGYAEQEPDRLDSLHAFWDALHLSGPADPAWLRRGEPARADFLLLLRTDQRRELLCLEFSLNAPSHPDDFSDDQAHLRELERYVRRVESRGVFSRLNAEVTGDGFQPGDGLANYLGVFSSQDKPLFKLCQGSAYVSRLAPRLLQEAPDRDALHVQVLALTQAGIEGLAARFGTSDTDPRTRLLRALGDTYRQSYKMPFQDHRALQIELQGTFRRIARALPPALRGELGDYLAMAPIGQPLTRTFSETVDDFCNPNQSLSLDTVMGWIDEDDAIAARLGAAPRQAMHSTLQAIGKAENPCLRDVHAAAVRAGLQAARPGTLTVLALEGHPGIGKTTAVRDWLQAQTSGFLFIYLSPRVLINSSVLNDLAQCKPLSTAPSAPSGILTLTSNRQFITNAAPHQQQTQHPGAPIYQGAVIFAGNTPAFVIPDPARSPRFFSISAAQELEARHTRAGIHKNLVSASRGEIHDKALPGVFRTLGTAARHALADNPTLNQLALTAAIQAYRELDESRSTIAGLSRIFKHKADTASGRRERQASAARLPMVIVMLDEIAGDGAGAVLTQKISRWLDQEFLTPFDDNGETSPFRVILVVADASLGHATVLKRYLESAKDTPDRILIASSSGPRPLRLAADTLRLGAHRWPALHIMADGFPARAPLTLRYDLSLLPLTRPAALNNQLPRMPHQFIRKATDEQLQQDALRIIGDALRDSEGQVLFFAQDRAFLETLAESLANMADPRNGQPFPDTAITTLHSDTPPWERERLAQPAMRDRFRVVLMTSSGSRGISFPRATHIIAVVPRFSVETGLMELAQLIYRGRGYYDDPERPGHRISGDHASRTLTFMVRDFILNDADTPAEERDRQWARQALDLLTFLILLRATIHTRLSGDAAMPGQTLSVAPVGCIGNDELHTFLADHLPGFLREMRAMIASRTITDKGRFRSALDRVQRLFCNATYRDWHSLIADRAHTARLNRSLTASAQPLVSEVAEWILPDNLYCVGPLWLERQDHSIAEELYQFDLSDPAREHEAQQLLGQLWAMNQDQHLPRRLREHADALHTLLKHLRHGTDPTESRLPDRRYTTAKSIAAGRTWIVLPVDYPRFLDGAAAAPATRSMGIADAARDDERWWQALYRAVAAVRTPGSVFPALPPYRKMPFLVIIVPGDPTDLERALDDRYFMASSELNLLNTLMFTTIG